MKDSINLVPPRNCVNRRMMVVSEQERLQEQDHEMRRLGFSTDR